MPPRPSRIRPGRLAALAAVVLLSGIAAPSADGQVFGRNKIQYDNFDWHILRTEHFDVYYYPEAEQLAQIGAAAAEEAYVTLEDRFDFSLGQRVPIVFYATNLHFKQTNITNGFIPDGVGGFFEFLKGRVVIPADGNIGRFRRVIRHEMVHVFTFNKLSRVQRDHRTRIPYVPPLWFTEGLAEYWSGAPDFQHEMIMRDAVASNYFVPLHDMDRIAGSYVMYKEGEAFCRFVAETYGEERLLDLIEEGWRSEKFTDVIEVVLGEDGDAVSDRWESWIREQYAPKLVGADVPSLTANAVAARGFSSKPVVRMRADGSRDVIYGSNQGSYSSLYAQRVDSSLTPVGRARVLVRGERSEDLESFHFFDSRMDVSDSGVLAFVTKRGAADVIHLVDADTGKRMEMLGFDGMVAIYSPTLNADASQVAFTGIDHGGLSDLYLYDRNTGRLRQLTNDVFDDRDPDFSPDGSQLAFSSDRTPWGNEGAYNLFTLRLADAAIGYVTAGPQVDLSPRWSPDGSRLAFASARREADGKFSAQNLWVADLAEPAAPALARRADASVPGGGAAPLPTTQLHQLTRFTSAAFDPYWVDSTRVVFASLEDFRFTVRTLNADSLASTPQQTVDAGVSTTAQPWAYPEYAASNSEPAKPYRRRYQLDVAQGGVTAAPSASFAAGGATLVFSDQLGNDRFFVTAYSSNAIGSDRNILAGLNVSVTRVHLGRRANFGYGAFRLAGPRYDRTDPEAPTGIPSYEEIYGGLGLVSYPISFFRRVDLQTSFGLGRKEGLRRMGIGNSEFDTLRTGLLANSATLVHDNALYGMFGPVEGARANVGLAYTTDVLYSNESYYTLSADMRHYLRISPSITLASWGLARMNVGRRARLNLIGGPWNLRGFPFLRVRGSKLWFTSQELRFTVMRRPPLYPVFAGLRGALFVDAAHNWTDGYDDNTPDPDYPSLRIGSTKGSIGAGLRTSLLGAVVLRYDLGWRFDDGFRWSDRKPFGQFFFGWDF